MSAEETLPGPPPAASATDAAATQGCSFERLLADHGAALVLYAHNWTQDQPTAEEVVQDAVVRCWQADPGLVRTGPAYLYVAVRNEALNRQRSRWRRLRWHRAAESPTIGDFSCPFAEGERREVLHRAITRLPEAQREVVHMHVWGGLTFSAIAAAQDCPVNTVSSRYRYALAALRDLLPPEDEPS